MDSSAAHLGCGPLLRFCAGRFQKPRHASISGDGILRSRHLRLLYVCERDHRPVEHGELEFDLAQAAWIRQHQDARIQRMAECFLQSYLKKKA